MSAKWPGSSSRLAPPPEALKDAEFARQVQGGKEAIQDRAAGSGGQQLSPKSANRGTSEVMRVCNIVRRLVTL